MLKRMHTCCLNTYLSIRNQFVRNLHVESQNTQGTCTTKDKIPNDLLNFESRFHYIAVIRMNSV